MNRPTFFVAAAAAAAVISIACSDIASPSRDKTLGYYDWRLPIAFDSVGGVDSLTFHWPRNHLPVKYWVEDQYNLPHHVQAGLKLWRDVFLYGEFSGVETADSASADVIVRAVQPPPQSIPGRVPPCVGATDVDTASTRFQLSLPIRIYIYSSVPGDTGLAGCLGRVAAHEIGHSLGLFQHSKDSLDLMFGTPEVDFPSDKDIRTITYVYHVDADMVPVRP